MIKSSALLEEAARLKAEDASLSCYAAFTKAARSLGLKRSPALQEISCLQLERAVRQYQETFRPGHLGVVNELRRRALSAMRFLDQFRPRLVGSILSGTADANSKLTLHLFADTPEEVMLFLMERKIPFVESTRQHRYRSGEYRSHPVFSFVADGQQVDLVVFNSLEIREAPLGAGDTGLIQRASVAQVEKLLEAGC
ncbi:MAG TPA: hypothetical protein ENN02_01560 [Halothiobacillus sp.]|nr:hypothetical protein [Halothiobacillus sp.]